MSLSNCNITFNLECLEISVYIAFYCVSYLHHKHTQSVFPDNMDNSGYLVAVRIPKGKAFSF